MDIARADGILLQTMLNFVRCSLSMCISLPESVGLLVQAGVGYLLEAMVRWWNVRGSVVVGANAWRRKNNAKIRSQWSRAASKTATPSLPFPRDVSFRLWTGTGLSVDDVTEVGLALALTGRAE
jgi:hypothetical protein